MKLLEATPHRPSLTVGVEAGVFAICIALLGAFPARLLLSMREGEGLGLSRIIAGTILDAAAVLPSIAVVVVAAALALALLLRPLRRAGWQGLGPMMLATPLAFATMVLSMIAQQVHAERGAFPTAFDILESANGSFVEGVLGFIGYSHVLVPTIVTALLAIVLYVVAWRRVVVLVRWPGWSLGVVLGAALATAPVQLGALAVGALAAPLSPEALGEPLAGLVDSALDLLRYGDKPTPRQLVVDMIRAPCTPAAPPSSGGPRSPSASAPIPTPGPSTPSASSAARPPVARSCCRPSRRCRRRCTWIRRPRRGRRRRHPSSSISSFASRSGRTTRW